MEDDEDDIPMFSVEEFPEITAQKEKNKETMPKYCRMGFPECGCHPEPSGARRR